MISEEIKIAIYKLFDSGLNRRVIYEKIDELFHGRISYRGVVSVVKRRFNVKKKPGRPFELSPHHHLNEMVTTSNDAQKGLVSGRELASEINEMTGVAYSGGYINKIRANLGKFLIIVA